jgi:23S rRNA U2552 (ribose-2'-O)-methylase RlmE/FtsJ
MKNYEEVFKHHDGFVSSKWVHYFYIYDRIFAEYRSKNKPLTILEIGVDRGGSLEIWKKYLPKGSKIHGVDINPECTKINFSEDIFFHLGSASDRNFMETAFKDIEFDIILDDGSHTCSDVIETFKIMFPKTKNGGLYVVEDLHTSYWGGYLGGYEGGFRKKGTSIEFFKDFIEAIHGDYIPASGFFHRLKNFISRKFREKKINEKVDVDKKYFQGIDYSKTIESIAFYDSICAIRKFSNPKNAPFKPIVSGKKDVDGISCFENGVEFVKQARDMFGG